MVVCQILYGQSPVRIQTEECGNRSMYKIIKSTDLFGHNFVESIILLKCFEMMISRSQKLSLFLSSNWPPFQLWKAVPCVRHLLICWMSSQVNPLSELISKINIIYVMFNFIMCQTSISTAEYMLCEIYSVVPRTTFTDSSLNSSMLYYRMTFHT